MNLQFVFLILYGLAYLYVWKLLLDVGNLGYLKPYALIWIASAFLCLIIGRKKNLPFVTFLVGSVLGPIGVGMFFFSKTDIRLLNDTEKNEDFYKRTLIHMQRKIGYLMDREIINAKWAGDAIPVLQLYADYFNLKLELPLSYNIALGLLESRVLLREWMRILVEFNKEYLRRFGKVMPEIKNLVDQLHEQGISLTIASKDKETGHETF